MPLLLTAVGPPRVYTPGARRDEAAAGMSASTRSVVVVSLATSALWTAVSFIAPKLRAHWCTKLSSGAHSEGSGADGGKCKGRKVSNAKPAPTSDDPLFHQVLKDAADIYNHEPALRASTRRAILRHRTLENALSSILADKLCGCGGHSNHTWVALFDEVYAMHAKYRGSEGTPGALARLDLAAVCDRDPACSGPAHALLYLKGFQALQAHRLAHALWGAGRRTVALAMQLKVSEVFGVDVHPAARLGGGLLIDHASGVVIGETCVVGRDCTILQGVTLGASGKDRGDRHPKIGNDVLIGAHAVILGNVSVGDGAKVGAGSVVLKSIPPAATAVGVPARVVGRTQEASAGKTMDHALHMVDTFGYVGSTKSKQPLWHDLWANTMDVGLDEKGFLSREELRVRLQPFGCSEAESDAVFWRLDTSLDNRVDENEFRASWEAAVVGATREGGLSR